jgi:hypothetical protein
MSSWSKDVVAASNITFTAGAAAHGCTDTASIATYWCHGLESSIQLGYWIGYRGTALAMPTVFLSFHTVAGVTVLSMAAWAVVSANARNRLAVPFFAINIIFAIQLLPACLAMQLLWKRILFTIACLASGIFGALGMATKLASGQQLERAFTRMPLVVTSREGAVWACWVVCMISAFGGAVLETLSVLTRYSIKRSSGDGVWPNLNAKANAPDDQTGHTPYDVPGFDLAFFCAHVHLHDIRVGWRSPEYVLRDARQDQALNQRSWSSSQCRHRHCCSHSSSEATGAALAG